jgi:1-acyl-sn-glycerol-3-phosphate acyltransferase
MLTEANPESRIEIPKSESRPATSGGAFRAILLLLFATPWTVFWALWCLIGAVFKSESMMKVGLGNWARGIVFCSGIRLAIQHKKELEAGKPYVLLSNHQSALDIPILMTACFPKLNVRFMSKESLFKIPFMGWAMSRTGFIPIRRENARHSAELFQEMIAGKETIKYSYILFPEGTRSEDGRLQPLKKGSIGLALRLGLPVVPVTLIDACRANPKGRILVRAGTVHVIFHEPISLEGQTRENRDELMERIHAKIGSALPEDQRQPSTTETQRHGEQIS